MKCISWNVNGIRSIFKKDEFTKILNSSDFDIVALQEVRATYEEIKSDIAKYLKNYYIFWNDSKAKKGYSGTAILSKIKPLSISYEMGFREADQEGRVIVLEYDNFYFMNIYTPNSGEELKRIDFRLIFDECLSKFIRTLNQKKPIILCGDLNVAHNEIDLKNPKNNINNAGFTLKERHSFSNILGSEFVDIFRAKYPLLVKYTWWSYRFNSREKGVGWRIDYFLTSCSIFSKIKHTEICDYIFGSDHCPVIMEIDI